MTSSTHQIKIKANDQTSGAFSSIQKRAAIAGANIKKMLGAAIAAGATYLGVRSIMASVDELGRLSDVAMKASTSVDELTSAATAFSILGINADVNSIATAFTKMAQTTGRTGMAGFYQTVAELGKIPDISKRSETTMKVFGKAGIEFLPLINAAKDGTNALQDVVNAMPKIPQAAADAGDKLSDAKTIGVAGFKKIWLEAIGKISEEADKHFNGGVREAAMDGVSYFSYFAKLSYKRVQWLFDSIGIIAGAISANWSNLMSDMVSLTKNTLLYLGTISANNFTKFLDWSGISEFVLGHKKNVYKGLPKAQLSNSAKSIWQDINGGKLEEELDRLIAAENELRKALEADLKKNEKAAKAYEEAATSTGNRLAADGIGSASKTPTISNKLILGGTADALKLSMLGPQTQNEMKKQTSLLTQIKDNTRKTADSVEEIDPSVFDLSEVN